MCFNAAKSWQLGWYAEKAETVTPVNTAIWYRRLVGIAEFSLCDETDHVILKLETGGETDFYVNFNRQTGMNSGTLNGGDEVIVTTQGGDGESYSRSTKLANLVEGEEYVIDDFGSSGLMVSIIVNTINVIATPGYAVVTITTLVSGPTPPPTTNPSATPTLTPTFPPTSAPSQGPSRSPEPSNVPSASSEPSLPPSGQPSMSAAPSHRPSLSVEPSDVPSNAPSFPPSAIPSREPLSTPSMVPSGKPSVSLDPTSSKEPSLEPSHTPSSMPSTEPSSTPSTHPSELPSETPTAWYTITYDDFEADNETNPSGWGSFNHTARPGVKLDAARVSSEYFQPFIPQGSAALRIRDNSGIYSSVLQDSDHDVTNFSNLRVGFSFFALKVEDGEGFCLEYSSNSGSIWTLIKEWIIRNNTDYENDNFYHESVDFNQESQQSYELTASVRIRFRCNATANRDFVFLDEVLFQGYGPYEA